MLCLHKEITHILVFDMSLAEIVTDVCSKKYYLSLSHVNNMSVDSIIGFMGRDNSICYAYYTPMSKIP